MPNILITYVMESMSYRVFSNRASSNLALLLVLLSSLFSFFIEVAFIIHFALISTILLLTNSVGRPVILLQLQTHTHTHTETHSHAHTRVRTRSHRERSMCGSNFSFLCLDML